MARQDTCARILRQQECASCRAHPLNGCLVWPAVRAWNCHYHSGACRRFSTFAKPLATAASAQELAAAAAEDEAPSAAEEEASAAEEEASSAAAIASFAAAATASLAADSIAHTDASHDQWPVRSAVRSMCGGFPFTFVP